MINHHIRLIEIQYDVSVNDFSEYLVEHTSSITTVSNEAINKLIELIIKMSNDSNSIIITAGNGGSASTAEHFAADLSQMEKRTGHSLRAICLNSQVALSSAFANDLGFEKAISQQLSSYRDFNFLFIAFSASGNSVNILNAINYSLSLNKKTFCFLGFDGGNALKIKGLNCIHFPNNFKNYGVVENLHLLASHYIVDRLVQALKSL